jgi:hypothetical protein
MIIDLISALRADVTAGTRMDSLCDSIAACCNERPLRAGGLGRGALDG